MRTVIDFHAYWPVVFLLILVFPLLMRDSTTFGQTPQPMSFDVLITGGTVYDGTSGVPVRRLSGLPATNLGLDHRGFIKEGMCADVVMFDPVTIADRATFEQPHQYAVGVKHVFVNGVQVLKDGEHTGAKPGRALWGPGKRT